MSRAWQAEEIEQLYDLAKRVRTAKQRRQVCFGKERLMRMLRGRDLGLVWLTEDLSKHSIHKIEGLCRKAGIPLFVALSSEDLGMYTGNSSVKVYILKRSFSGIKHVIRELEKSGVLDSGK